MPLGLLDCVNFGYSDLEPGVVGLMAMNKSYVLIGRHGTGEVPNALFETHNVAVFTAKWS